VTYQFCFFITKIKFSIRIQPAQLQPLKERLPNENFSALYLYTPRLTLGIRYFYLKLDRHNNYAIYMKKNLNTFSRLITQDESLPAAQAMLYAIGMDENDQRKAQVGIVSTGFQGNPCNMHLNGLADALKKEVDKQEELYGLIFHTIGVSDGITNGTEGMKYSLPSREIIADSIETVVSAQFYDAVIPIVGCDKNMPGAMMALARLNRPAILMYGGTVKKGRWNNRDLNIVSAFEAYGERIRGFFPTLNTRASFATASPVQGLAEECTLPIQWLQPLNAWA
jgi:dihydroxy-acid dehydratase